MFKGMGNTEPTAPLHQFSNDHPLSETFMKNLQHIEKSGFHRGQYVGYGGGKVWTIHPSTSSYGKWRAFNQRDPGECRYGWTLTKLDTYFHTLSEPVQKQSAIQHKQLNYNPIKQEAP